MRRGPVPIWYQIREAVRRKITDGELRPGDRLPTEHELMVALGVSRTPVRSALGSLADQGLVERFPGRGTFVCRRAIEQPVNVLRGFHADMEARGVLPSTVTLQTRLLEHPDTQDAAWLGIGDEPVVLIERLLVGDGATIGLSRSRLPSWVLGGGPLWAAEELDAASLYRLMEQRAAAGPRRADETIEAVAAVGEVADALEVGPGTPVLRATRLSFDAAGRPVEMADLWYRPDRYRYRVDLVAS